MIEHVGGEMQIYHGRDVVVMANEPSMDKQMELLKKFQPWGGDIVLPKGLPGSVASEDRFVRLNYYLQYTPKPTTEAMAIAIVKSLIARLMFHLELHTRAESTLPGGSLF